MISGSFTDLTGVDFTPGLALDKYSRGTQSNLSCSMYNFKTASSENCAAIYRLRETSHIPSSGGGITLNLSQHENQASLS